MRTVYVYKLGDNSQKERDLIKSGMIKREGDFYILYTKQALLEKPIQGIKVPKGHYFIAKHVYLRNYLSEITKGTQLSNAEIRDIYTYMVINFKYGPSSDIWVPTVLTPEFVDRELAHMSGNKYIFKW